LISNATFVGRSFAGNPKQVKELLKAAFAHNGIAVLDIISPCVTFNNQENAYHSYAWGKDHEEPLHEISYIAPRNEIMLEQEMMDGEVREVSMHDGSTVILKNLEKGYDSTSRMQALQVLEEARQNNWLLTGLIYVNTEKPSLTDIYNLVDTPLNRLTETDLRPDRAMIDKINALMFYVSLHAIYWRAHPRAIIRPLRTETSSGRESDRYAGWFHPARVRGFASPAFRLPHH
jgi:2-oxoglutarate ferredoxin oxidoreductase subunit beta